MGLFSALGQSLVKFASDSASGIRYVSNDDIEAKVNDFLLHYKYLLEKAYSFKDKGEIVSVLVLTAIAVAKSDGNFSNTEVTELVDFVEASLGDEVSREEALDMIREFNNAPLDMEYLGREAMGLKNLYGEPAIEVIRSFIEYIIYSDGEVHPKELDFLNNWDKTIKILKSHS